MPSVGKLETFRTRVVRKIGDIESPELKPSEDVLGICIDAGVNQYSRIRPRTVVDEVAGDATARRYVLNSVLSLWNPEFSHLTKIALVESKNLDSEIETEFKESQTSRRKDSSGNDVVFVTETIEVGKDIRFEYTAGHVIDLVTAADTTIPDIDTDLLTALAASYVASWIARKASDLANVQIGTSEIDYGRLRSHWSERSKELLREASELVDPKMVAHSSTGVAVEWSSLSRLAPRRISH